jgi:hypothetical protein
MRYSRTDGTALHHSQVERGAKKVMVASAVDGRSSEKPKWEPSIDADER